MPSPFRVRVFRGEQLLDERIFNDTLVKLGRHSSAQVPLEDRSAAFVHAVLTLDGDKLALTDISGRGTFVNGKSISKRILQPDDEIRIAGLRILIDWPAAATPGVDPPATPGVEAPAPSSDAPPSPTTALEAAASQEPAASEPAHGSVLDRIVQFPRRAFGSYVAREPATPRTLRSRDTPALQLACYWGDKLLQLSQHSKPQVLAMGPAAHCAVKAGSWERRLIEPDGDGGFALHVEDGERAHLRRGGKNRELGPGVHPLEPSDLAWLELEGLRVEASFAARPPRIKAPLGASVDFRLVNLVLLLTLLAAAFAISAAFHVSEDLVGDDFGQIDPLVVRVMEPIQRAHQVAEAVAQREKREPAEQPPKHQGADSMAGDPILKNRRRAFGAIGKVRLDTRDLAPRPGLLAGLGSPAVVNVMGAVGFQGDVRAALGNLVGPTAGAAAGLGGLGLRGSIPDGGGGGVAQTVGIGDVHTLGRASGNDRYGTGLGLIADGKSRPPTVLPDSTPPEIGGALDPEIVRQVIRSHVSQIRFCYESRLASRPSLEGKIRVRFLVASDGRVPQASIAEGSTLHDSELSECILSRFRSWIFPSPKGGGSALVTYPFWLRPNGE